MKVHVIGEDSRSKNLRNLYMEQGTDIVKADIIFCPIPFTRDNVTINTTNIKIEELLEKIGGKILISGVIKDNIREILENNNIRYIDIMEYEEFNILNAQATSEGAIKKAIEMTDKTLNNSNILILGYGRIGKMLAHNLSGFTSKIFVEARKEKDIALIKTMGYNEVGLDRLDEYLEHMDIIFNTIPSMILDKSRVDKLKKNVCIIDLASNPGGVDFEYCALKNINTCWYLAVPSKDSPLSAAMYIKDTVDKIIGEGDIWEKKLM